MEWIHEITDEHLKRWQKDASYYAKEPVTVEKVGNVFYAYGSELAMRRIEYTFRGTKDLTFGFSKNLDTWYVGLWIK